MLGPAYFGASGIAVDGSGYAYAAGIASNSNFPITPGALGPAPGVFVTKLNVDGTGLVFSSAFGDPINVSGTALDANDSAYVTGSTDSATFPVTPGAFQTHLHGLQDAFVSKLSPDGSTLLFSTYLGGAAGVFCSKGCSEFEEAFAIAVDSAGHAYVAGATQSSDFPIINALQGYVSKDAFVSEFTPDGSGLLFSTFLGGGQTDDARAIAVDSSNNVYLVGDTSSTDFPTTSGSLQSSYGSSSGSAFITKISPAPGPGMEFSPATLSFTDQRLGTTSAPLDVAVANVGDGAMTISTRSGTGDFAQSNNCGSLLAPSATCTVAVMFSPTAVGSRQGTLTISDSAPRSPHMVMLQGLAIAPNVSLSPQALTFAPQAIGTTSAPQNVVLANSGTTILDIRSVSASGDFAVQSNNCGTTLTVGSSCTVGTIFTPSAPGGRTGFLVFADDAGSSPQQANLSGGGPDFVVSASTTSMTISAGQAANFPISVSGLGGFNGNVSFSCSGAIATMTCNVSPPSSTVSGSTATTVTAVVTTTSNAALLGFPKFWERQVFPAVLITSFLATLLYLLLGNSATEESHTRFDCRIGHLLYFLWRCAGEGC